MTLIFFGGQMWVNNKEAKQSQQACTRQPQNLAIRHMDILHLQPEKHCFGVWVCLIPLVGAWNIRPPPNSDKCMTPKGLDSMGSLGGSEPRPFAQFNFIYCTKIQDSQHGPKWWNNTVFHFLVTFRFPVCHCMDQIQYSKVTLLLL
jgi:hypothetical protein